jgi:hypothetical protein
MMPGVMSSKSERIKAIESEMQALLAKSRQQCLMWDDPEAVRIREALLRLQTEWKALR